MFGFVQGLAKQLEWLTTVTTDNSCMHYRMAQKEEHSIFIHHNIFVHADIKIVVNVGYRIAGKLTSNGILILSQCFSIAACASLSSFRWSLNKQTNKVYVRLSIFLHFSYTQPYIISVNVCTRLHAQSSSLFFCIFVWATAAFHVATK